MHQLAEKRCKNFFHITNNFAGSYSWGNVGAIWISLFVVVLAKKAFR